MGNCESDVLGPSDGGLIGRSLKVCRLVHQRGPGWNGMGILGVFWAWWMVECSEVPKPRLLAHLGRYPCDEGCDLLMDVDHEPK